MTPHAELTHFAGFDRAGDHHDIIIVDASGTLVADFQIEHSAAGWRHWKEKIAAYPKLGVAIETSFGMVVEQIIDSGATVYPVNPMSARRYRERRHPSGTKTDRHDAWALADALRTDGHAWRALGPKYPIIVELRILCRDEVALIEERTALINQLRQALREHYPTALEAFAKAAEWHLNAGMVKAKSLYAIAKARQLRTLQTQLEEYRRRIEELFASHPDSDLFGSLPGAGPKLAPRLLSEVGSDRALYDDAQGLQCVAGTAPVSFQSGKIKKANIRRACNRSLRHAMHLFAHKSTENCVWAKTYYDTLREKGKSHAQALRCLGQRWMKIIWKMWQTHTRYDGDLHMKNQLAHGSWVLQINPA